MLILTKLTNENIVSELKRIFSEIGKVATKSGYLEIKLSNPQKIDVNFYDNKLLFSSVDIEVDSTLSELNIVRFSLPEIVSVLDILRKRELFELSYSKDQNVFWLNGLPLFNTEVFEDGSIFIPETSVKYNQKDWLDTLEPVSEAKKDLKKGFSKETEFLLIDIKNGEVRFLDNFDVKIVGKFASYPSGDTIFLDKINSKVLEALFSKIDSLDVSFNKKSIVFNTDDVSLQIEKTQKLNKKLYYPI